MIEPDPGKQYCRVKSAKRGGSRVKCRWIPHGCFLEQRQSQVKEVLQVEPKLPSWEVSMQLLVAREFLAEEE
jgi:transposase InsO family protein